MSEKFRALRVEQGAAGFTCAIQRRDLSDLADGDVLIRVLWSSLNYKDALSASGNKGVTRRFPHTPGIDVAGVVERASDGPWKAGDKVIVTGYDLGMNTDGGFGEFVSVPADWVVRCPLGLTLRSSMVLGTAGLTAALSVSSLVDAGIDEGGDVLVTGASGGVGSVAVALLSQLGYRVTAVTGRESSAQWLKSLGASDCLSREALLENSAKPMLAPKWSGVVDAVGGEILAAAIKGLRYGASATCCGMAGSADLPLNVFPFILRGVNLLGVDSVELPVEIKQQVWDLLGTDWSLNKMADLVAAELSLEELPAYFPQILAGQVRGRAVVKVAEE